MKIAVSYLGSKNIYETINKIDLTDADYIHVDVMDGKYVTNKVNSYGEIKNIGHYTRKRLDIHFMVSKPLKLIDDYATLNVSCMTFHLDVGDDLKEIINKCKMYGINVGIAIDPKDDITSVYPYLQNIDLVLIMTVVPGLPGQELIKDVIPKIGLLKKEIKKQKVDVKISVDGGINDSNNKLLKDADILVSGSFVTKSNNYQEMISKLRNIKEEKVDKFA